MVNYALNTVTERDMDLLFSNALASDPGFLSLFVSKAGITCINPIVTDVIISKTETRLGESDITLHLDLDGKKYGFLIEDKIDAINMPDQYRRYVRRGERGVQRGDYDRFEVFIVCPAKYYAIRICFFSGTFLASFFGRVIVRTPSSYLACTSSSVRFSPT